MKATSLTCPSCRAPLTPPEEGTRLICSFCGVLVLLEGRSHAEDFETALRQWRNPEAQGFLGAFELGDTSWITGQRIGGSPTSEAFVGQLARWPTGFGIVRVLHPGAEPAARADRAWDTLVLLTSRGQTRKSAAFVTRLPLPLVRGTAKGTHEAAGRQIMVTSWRPGFRLTLREAKALHGGRIPATAAVWVWRRLLETLEYLHRLGIAHGGVLPQHLLIEDGEHGISLVGFGSSGELSQRHVPSPEPGAQDFVSDELLRVGRLSTALDLQMSARTVIDALGGDAAAGTMPREVPEPLAAVLREIALARPAALEDLQAIELHRRVGEISSEVFGAPAFHPLTLRSGARGPG